MLCCKNRDQIVQNRELSINIPSRDVATVMGTKIFFSLMSSLTEMFMLIHDALYSVLESTAIVHPQIIPNLFPLFNYNT